VLVAGLLDGAILSRRYSLRLCDLMRFVSSVMMSQRG
jgi:hypothetical protein